MKVFDEVLDMEIEVHEEVTPENGIEIFMNEPEELKEVFGGEE